MSNDAQLQNPEKDTSDWVTGDEPMTGPQHSYLQTLTQEATYARRIAREVTNYDHIWAGSPPQPGGTWTRRSRPRICAALVHLYVETLQRLRTCRISWATTSSNRGDK